MEDFKAPEKAMGSELVQNVEEIELPDLPDFYPEIFDLVSRFRALEADTDTDVYLEKYSRKVSEVKKIGDIETLRQYFLFHVVNGSSPDMLRLTRFDTPNKDLANLMKRILNNNI